MGKTQFIPLVIINDIKYEPGDCVYIEPYDKFEFDIETEMRKKRLKKDEKEKVIMKEEEEKEDEGLWIGRLISIFKVLKNK